MEHICVFLIRHGQTDWNVKKRIQGSIGVGLNTKGKHQALAVAKKLANRIITTIYSSPLQRTIQTAKIIAQSHKLTLITISGFKERNYGAWEGMTSQELDEKYPTKKEEQDNLGIDWRPPQGESSRELFERVRRAFKKIISKHKSGDCIVIVSHGGTLRALIHWLHGGKPEDLFHTNALDNAELVEVHWNKGVTKIVRSVEHLNELNA